MDNVIIKYEVPGGEFVESVDLSFKVICKILLYKLKGYKIKLISFTGETHNEYTLYITYNK